MRSNNDFDNKDGTVHSAPLAVPLDLEEGRALPFFSGVLKWLSLLILLLIVIAAFAPVREMAIAQGQIMPEGSVQPVQHLEGGIVAEVMTGAGQIIEKGAPIVRLAPVQASSERDQLQGRRVYLDMQRRRLNALLIGQKPVFDTENSRAHDYAAEQLALYRAETALERKEQSTLKARIAQRRSEVVGLESEIVNLEAQLEIEAEQLAMRERLLKSGYTSRVNYLEVKSSYVRTKSQLAQARSRKTATREALVEAKSLYAEYLAGKARERHEAFTKVSAELAETEATLKRLDDRVERLFVRAPQRSYVHEVTPKAVGEVIRPGDIVAKLVPIDDKMVAEVELKPSDVGHVRSGHPVEVKVTAFDSELYGAVAGTVKSISPTTFEDEKGNKFYKAIVALDRSAVGRGEIKYPLLPGMVVNAEIATGAKSVLQYVLKPVYRSVNVAFSER